MIINIPSQVASAWHLATLTLTITLPHLPHTLPENVAIYHENPYECSICLDNPPFFSCFCSWHAAICAAAWQPCAVCHPPNNINFLWKTSWDQRKANFHSTWNNNIVAASIVVTFWSSAEQQWTRSHCLHIFRDHCVHFAFVSVFGRSSGLACVCSMNQWTNEQWAQEAIEPSTETRVAIHSSLCKREVYYQNNLLNTVSTLALIYRSRIGSRRAAAVGSRQSGGWRCKQGLKRL